jgi:hypothetical protein
MSEEYERIKREISAANFPKGKFSPKMASWRQQVMALHLAGIPVKTLAEAFGVRPQTISKMFSPNSGKYLNEKTELKEIGSEAFQLRYLTPEAWARVKDLQLGPEGDRPRPLKNAKKHAKWHTVVADGGEGRPHRIFIAWRDADETNVGDGWYYQDHDAPVEQRGQWFHNGDESRLTSTACLAAIKENLYDIE